MTDLDLFAGPGGWSEAARMLGIREVGIEHDAAACATRAAAGHRTIRADVAAFPVGQLAGKIGGLISSPPCTTFSAAGKRAGTAFSGILAAGIRDALNDRKTRAERRREMAAALRGAWWPHPKMTRAERSAAIWKAVRSASLVIEPARFIFACRPEWIALEQVPSVLPLWEVYAAELRTMGYSTWAGKLNAADYGVPQTRERVILIASRVREVWRPEPTHYDPRKGDQLWGAPWVSMADALGWGMDARPYFALCTAGGSRGGADEQVGGSGARRALYAERDAGRWALRMDAQAHATLRSAAAPAPALKFGHSAAECQWVLHTNRDQREDGSRQTADPSAAPAPALTAKSGGQWVMRRPATTVQGDPRIGRPGHKDRGKGEARFAVDSVRITVQEAAILQSFRPDYPWQGTMTKQFEQVGNAVPVLLAAHVLSMATGIPFDHLATTEAA